MRSHPAAKLLPLLEGVEFDKLCEDVRENGLLEEIVTHEGLILDGRNRFRACKKVKVKPRFVRWKGEGGSPVRYAISKNLHRRHLTRSQRAMLAASPEVLRLLEKEAREEARKKAKAAGKKGGRGKKKATQKGGGNNATTLSGRKTPKSRDKAGALYNVGGRYVQDAKKIQEEDPELAKEVKSGKKTLPEAKKALAKKKKEKARKAAAKAAAKIELPDRVRVLTGDFRKVLAGTGDDSVDLIFTDPPYDTDSIPLYGDLAELGARVLKPGGSLVCMVGTYAIPKILHLMCPHLRYWWTFAFEHTNQRRFPGKFVFVGWKPLLWFVKDTRRDNTMVSDLILPEAVPAKELHDWEQSEVTAAYCIEHLTMPGEIVLDPMCGSGTTLVAAARLGRQVIGVESDPGHANRARKRIASETA